MPLPLLTLAAALAAENHLVAVPTAGYDSDDGLGFGARAELTRVAPGVDPYVGALVAQGYVSLEGYRHYKARFDLPHLGADEGWRLSGNLGYRRWRNDGYWGLGNGAIREVDAAPGFYRYSLEQPYARLTLSRAVRGPLSLFGALEGKWSGVTADPDSLLAQEQPYGMDGGWSLQGTAGLRVDTRAPEVTPARGGLLEIAARYAPPLPGGAGSFGGGSVSLRRFWTLDARAPEPRLSLGARAMAEYLTGEVPFYEMVHWGGWLPVAGMGGADTLRGVSFGRLHGPGKAVLNAELRIDALEHTLRDRPVRWQVVPFLDSGLCFGVPEADQSAPAPAWPLTHGAGAGIRAIYDTTLVGRVDVAAGWDRTTPGAPRRPDLGVYLVFDHAF